MILTPNLNIMKNNILGAMVIFFAVVACLLIIDDLSYNEEAKMDYTLEKSIVKSSEKGNLATTDLEIED
jgi:hypothetical protein